MELFTVSAAGLVMLAALVIVLISAVRLRRGSRRARYFLFGALAALLVSGGYAAGWLWIYFHVG